MLVHLAVCIKLALGRDSVSNKLNSVIMMSAYDF